MTRILPEPVRYQPVCFPCFGTAEVKALTARMIEIASEILMDVETYVDDFAESLEFPRPVFQRMDEFRAMYDRFLSEVIIRTNLAVTCTKGCSACCHILPCGLEPLEILDIYQRIKQWHDFENVLDRSQDAMAAFKKALRGVAQKQRQRIKNSSEGFALALSDYALLRNPCIFLDKVDGTCRIYEIRPLICRAVFSLSDPACCDPAHPGYAERVLEIIEPVDEINYVLIQINAVISETLGARFPEIMQHGLLAWHRWVKEKTV